jgi:hypothetical protein
MPWMSRYDRLADKIVVLAVSAWVTGENPVAMLKLTVQPSVTVVSVAAILIGRLLTSSSANILAGPGGRQITSWPAATSAGRSRS